MLIAGIILIVIGLVAGAVGYFQHRKLMELVSVETSTVAELRELANAVNETEAAAGAFSQRCEVVGAAKGQSGGGLDAPNSNQKCVWYRTQVTEKYWDHEWVGEGNNRRQQRVERTRTLSDSNSEFDFVIDDGTGTLVVRGRNVDVDQPQKVYDQFTPSNQGGLGGFLESFASQLTGGGNSIGIQTEEWVVPIDARLFAQGEVSEVGGQLTLDKGDKGPFRVSLRSEQEMTKSADRWRKVNAGIAIFGVGVGVILAIVGAITA
jgi:hypothetical protein